MKTKVVRLRTPEAKGCTKIDRTTMFGNPFTTQGRSRAMSLILYDEYFHWRIRYDGEFRKAVEALRGKTLGCWCTPNACHGDVIVEYLEGGE